MKSCRNGHVAERTKFGACKECLREASIRWRLRHPDRARKRSRDWDRKNRELVNARRQIRRDEKGLSINQVLREWRARNPEKVKEYAARHGARIMAERRAHTPKWVDREALKAIYAECPPGYEVDHIVPILGKNFSGLHVPWNLQYLTVRENRSKGNRLSEDVGSPLAVPTLHAQQDQMSC